MGTMRIIGVPFDDRGPRLLDRRRDEHVALAAEKHGRGPELEPALSEAELRLETKPSKRPE